MLCFLGQGSTNSLCDKRLLERLCVTSTKAEFSLSTLTNSVTQSGNKIDLKVSSLAGDGTLHLKGVLSVSKLPIRPNPSLSKQEKRRWPHLQGLNLSSLGKQEVLLLISVDAPEAFWVQEERRGKPGEPFAVKTVLGWSLLGPSLKLSMDIESVNTHFPHNRRKTGGTRKMYVEIRGKSFYRFRLPDV